MSDDPKDDQRPQIDKFRDAARALRTDDDPKRYAERVRKLAKASQASKTEKRTMTYHVEIIELSSPTDEGFLSQKLPEAYPTLEAARTGAQAYADRRDAKLGRVTFRIVDENGNPAEDGDG
ncbi:hypothetical protein [Hansschlegelia sp.]|uniref:hypothetical protein n=1 Tax=Hansschlegelia sp. TaxID=2041892 RepID=UPI002C2E2F8C|nr:hypothetical protein [Hansschlegelia sp.]HVI30430.1 hypothetical protein [Hansschlegelia sp.]